MNWFQYLECVLLPLALVVDIIALFLLYKQRNKRRHKHQMYLIGALVMSEINGIFSVVVTHIIFGRISGTADAIMWFYIHIIYRLTYYSTMTLLTIDRFLVFHLNIKYLATWPPEKLLKSLACIYVVSFLVFICFICLIVLKLIDWRNFANIMFIPYSIWDVIYIVQVILTYFYIFRKYKKHKRINKCRKNRQDDREQFKLVIPTLIILTFIMFTCIPDLINSSFQLFHVENRDLIFLIIVVNYRIGWLADPLIYIYNCKLLKKRKNNNNVISFSQTSHL